MILAGVTAPGGSGVSARIEGFTVGGKTGTGQKANPNTKGYSPGVYVSSFAGFFPVHEPKYVIYVVVDNPKKNAYYGSQVAAPLFARIAGSIVRTEGLAPVTLKRQILGASETDSRKDLAARKPAGKAETTPDKQSEANEHQAILRAALEQGIVPPLHGLTVRELLRVVNGYNLDLKIKGAGRVSRTYPSAGEKVFKNRQFTVFMN
jgi:cell division protein FtsI (penicillin-binding protein 3)